MTAEPSLAADRETPFRALFLSDVHLGRTHRERQKLLIDLLEAHRPSLDEVFILGDLFEFWISYRSAVFSHFVPILGALRRLSDAGVRITYLAGNHDFAFNDTFHELTGAEVHLAPISVLRAGLRIYLCHGDQINGLDRSYLLLRRLLHNRFLQSAMRLIHPDLAWRIAERVAKTSRKKSPRGSIPDDQFRLFIAQRSAERCDLAAHGHTHRPALARFSPSADHGPFSPHSVVVLNPGEWIDELTYGLLSGHTAVLMRYPDTTLERIDLTPRATGRGEWQEAAVGARHGDRAE